MGNVLVTKTYLERSLRYHHDVAKFHICLAISSGPTSLSRSTSCVSGGVCENVTLPRLLSGLSCVALFALLMAGFTGLEDFGGEVDVESLLACFDSATADLLIGILATCFGGEGL